MAVLDFQPFGRNAAVTTPLDIVHMRLGNSPVFVLLSEKHSDNATIADNVQATVELLDQGIANRIYTEDFFDWNIREAVEKEACKLFNCANLEERSRQVHEGYANEAEIFADLRSVPQSRFKISFPRWVLYMRPNAKIFSVEHPDLKREADAVADQVGGEPVQLADPEAERLRKIKKARDNDVHRRREVAFFSTAIADAQNEFAVVLNAGGYHNPWIARLLEGEGFGYILTRPPNYTDELVGG